LTRRSQPPYPWPPEQTQAGCLKTVPHYNRLRLAGVDQCRFQGASGQPAISAKPRQMKPTHDWPLSLFCEEPDSETPTIVHETDEKRPLISSLNSSFTFTGRRPYPFGIWLWPPIPIRFAPIGALITIAIKMRNRWTTRKHSHLSYHAIMKKER